MEIPQEIDNYIKESIDHTMGLPVSTQTLQFKLLHSQESLQRVRNQCSLLLSKVKEKDQIIERARVCISTSSILNAILFLLFQFIFGDFANFVFIGRGEYERAGSEEVRGGEPAVGGRV